MPIAEKDREQTNREADTDIQKWKVRNWHMKGAGEELPNLIT